MSNSWHYAASKQAVEAALRTHCVTATKVDTWAYLAKVLTHQGIGTATGARWTGQSLCHACYRWGIKRENFVYQATNRNNMSIHVPDQQRAEVVLQTVCFWEHYAHLSERQLLTPTYVALAQVLNRRGLTTARGLEWSPSNLTQFCINRGISLQDIDTKRRLQYRLTNPNTLRQYDLRFTPTEPWPISLVPSLMDQPKPLSHWKVGHIQLHDNVMEEPTAAEQFKMLSPTWLPPRPAQASDANGEGGKPCGSDEEPSLCDGPTTSVQPFRIYE